MITPIGIEGDYIETKKTHLFFDVKGLHHPNDRKICFIRFYPHENGDRLKAGLKYKKIYDLDKRYSFLKTHFPNHLFFSPELDMELQCVKNEEIEKIYSPRTYFISLYNKKVLSKNEKISKSLCKLFINEGKIPKNLIGITGSQMIGLNKQNSDIDLIIYGTQISLNFQKNLKKIYNSPNKCRMYSKKDYETHYNWRVGGSGIPYETFFKTESRKLHQGKYEDRDFFIRYIKSPEDWKGNYYDYNFKNLGRISIKAEITDSTNSIFTPCSYKIKAIKILKSIISREKLPLKRIHEINSYRGRFCEQAVTNEIVTVIGKLEQVQYKEEQEYYRILLSDQRCDKMIVLT